MSDTPATTQQGHQPGLMVLASGEIARYAACRTSIEGIARPAGTRRYSTTCLSLAENWNAAAELLTKMPEMQWLFLMNDDHMFEADVLIRLLDRMAAHDLDAVTGLYLERSQPFAPQLYMRSEERGYYVKRFLKADDPDLIQVDASGDGCLLVHRKVIEALYKEHKGIIWELGYGPKRVMRQLSNHDIAFCAKLRGAGFELWADLTVRVGHTTSMTVWPNKDDTGAWVTDVKPRPDRTAGMRFAATTGDEQ